MTKEEKRLQELEAENQKLREEIAKLRPSFRKRSKKFFKRGRIITEAYLGRGLKNSIQKFLTELTEQKTVSKDTVSDLSSRLVMRFTRLGRIGFLLALIPILFTLFQTWLLFNQNTMIEKQNQIAEKQTEIAKNQTDLMGVQNSMVQNQTDLMDSQTNIMKFQNIMFGEQNKMVEKQTTMIDWQNRLFENQNLLVQAQTKRIDQQTYLQEAERRSTLVFLMGNIFDEVSNELKAEANKDKKLSPQLVGRIIAISHSLIPYKSLMGGELSKKEYSAERGQLLITLVNSGINENTLRKIYEKSNFKHSYLFDVDLSDAYLYGVDLSGSMMRLANLQGANLQYATLKNVNLIEVNLDSVKLNYSTIHKTEFYNAKLNNTDFTFASLDTVWVNKRVNINKSAFDKNFICSTFYGNNIKDTVLTFCTKK